MKTKQIIIISFLFTLSISSFSQSNWNYGTGYISINNPTTSNFGLGTTPTNILDVVTGAGNTYGNYALFRTSGAYGFQGGILVSNSASSTTGNNSFRITSSYNGSLNAYTKAKFGFVDNSSPETWLLTGNVPSLEFVAINGNVNIAQGTGNVGIGTTTLGSKLQVNGNAAIGYSASTTAPTNGLCVSGNVGIGTTSTTSKLYTIASGSQSGNYSGNLLTNIATSSTSNATKAGLEVRSTGTWSGASGSRNIGLWVSNVSGATYFNYDAIFNGGGNVGIGLYDPTALFHTQASGIKNGSYVGNLLTNIATSTANGATKAGLQVISTGNWTGSTGSRNIGIWVSDVNRGTAGTQNYNYDAIFNGGGKVGIGLLDPTEKFQVDGGNILVRGVDNFQNQGNEAKMYFGDNNQCIKSINGSGLSISTYGAPDLICLNQQIGSLAGYVRIGTGSTQNVGGYKLIVEGNVAAKEFVATLDPTWPDFVFSKEFNLMPLTELESFVNINKHLPNVPSASDVKEKGINLGEMSSTLLQKVEELTLYIIDLKKENDEMKKENNQLKNRISNLENK